MNFPYVVVQFLREGTFSEIPTSWLTKDFTQCRWPTTKNVTFFIKNNRSPETDWSLLNVKVECHCETLEKAQKIAEDANYAISHDETRKRKRIIYIKKFDDMYDTRNDSEDDDDDLLPQYKTPQKQLKIYKSQDSSEKTSLCDKQFLLKKQSYEKVSHIAAKENSSIPNNLLRDKSPTQIINSLQTNKLNNSNELLELLPTQINRQNLDFISTTTPLSMAGDIGKLIPICIQTLNYVKSIDQKLKVLEESIIDIKEPMNVFDDILPINSIENLQKFEEKLENAKTRMHWVQFIKKIGGKNSKNLIHRCMSRLFTNEFGKACSWRGRRNNYRICDLKCICILKSVLRAKGVEESEFENIASEWLRFSKMRNDREIKKVLPGDNVHEQMDSSLHESEPQFLYAEVFCKDEETDDTCIDQELTQK
ncbi:uncharacterized protein LOC105834614 isoform X1 [Monomorium pharaonis]|uniref:uncharacterized protein LOC105834614 isoform X1 n=1 Tax=Monomorium pharaonis TaxID=307658 RepID=UPI00063F5A07|nr:uncharacterized protein LOC105834614 isoform X1 [Monomorium pharaonis]